MTAPIKSTSDSRRPGRRFTVDAAQNGILIGIVLLVGFMAGAASFNHVHDWTLDHSPADTPGWFGWANAVITELIPTASLIEIGRRRRNDAHAKVSYPMFLLIAAVGISLTAQLAVAEKSLFGWMVSALPALAFFALSKLVFTVTAHRPTTPVAASTPATSHATSPDTERAEVSPAAASTTRATPRKRAPAKKTTPSKKTPAKKTTPPAAPTTVPATVPAPAPALSAHKFPEVLLSNAKAIATSHRDTHDEPIKPNQLAVRLRIPTATAADILTQLENHPPAPANTQPHNGATIGATA
jgi:hypothetical protein